MNIGTILIILLVLLLVGAFPGWSWSANWGHGPISVLGVLLVIVIILLVTGKL